MKNFWKIYVVVIVLLCITATLGLTYFLFKAVEVKPISLTTEKIAVIPIKGEITYEGCPSSLFSGVECAEVEYLKKRLSEADNDASVKAIVLEINSGGGGVVASQDLAYAVKKVRKPVVAYIRDVGASGAYYVASAADYIVAERNSMTGSIGVVMTVHHIYGLYRKLGINVTVIKSGKVKDVGSPYRPMTDEEKKELTDMVNKIHEDFIYDVAVNRNLSLEHVKKIADGRIILGRDALDLGLVDALGGLDDAVEAASRMAKVTGKPEVEKTRTRKPSILDYFT